MYLKRGCSQVSVAVLQDADASEARLPTGDEPSPSVDVSHIPTEQLTPLDNPKADAQVCCKASPLQKPVKHCHIFIAAEQIQCAKTNISAQAALFDLQSSDWAIACRGQVQLRRLAVFHSVECRPLL